MKKAVRQSRLIPRLAGALFGFVALLGAPAAFAQATPGSGGAATTPPAAVAPAQSTPAPSATPAPPADITADSATVVRLVYPAKPVASLAGSATWDQGFTSIMAAFEKVRTEMKTASLTAAGRPIAVFLETDDEGFKFEAMIPLAAPPGGGGTVGNGVRVGLTPTGDVLKFQHRGAYDDIDATYEAITAYLDEKGLNAANLFIEEYLNDVQGPDDNELAIDIYVFMK